VRNYHELGECWPSKESVVRCLEVGCIELQVFSTEVFSSPEGHGKSDLANWGHCSTRGDAMKWGMTGAQHLRPLKVLGGGGGGGWWVRPSGPPGL
jgi:hypothetical protein